MEYSPSLGIQVEEAGMKYKDRGDPAVPDFTKADFVIDEAWHELDLTSVIPTSANLVFFRFPVLSKDLGPAGELTFREPDNVNEQNQSENIFNNYTHQVMTKNGKVAYRINDVPENWDIIDLVIRGWIED